MPRPGSLAYMPIEYSLHGESLVEDGSSKLHHLFFSYDVEIKNTIPEPKQMSVEKMTSLFPEGDTTDVSVSGGLDIHLVDHEACQDKNRMVSSNGSVSKCATKLRPTG